MLPSLILPDPPWIPRCSHRLLLYCGEGAFTQVGRESLGAGMEEGSMACTERLCREALGAGFSAPWGPCFSCKASAQGLISCAWLSWLPNRRLARCQAAAGRSLAPPPALRPAGKQWNRQQSQPRHCLVTRPLPLSWCTWQQAWRRQDLCLLSSPGPAPAHPGGHLLFLGSSQSFSTAAAWGAKVRSGEGLSSP